MLSEASVAILKFNSLNISSLSQGFNFFLNFLYLLKSEILGPPTLIIPLKFLFIKIDKYFTNLVTSKAEV